MRPAVFLSASIPTGKKYDGSDRHLETARPQWIRDAVLAIARAAFAEDFDLVFGAHPSISPMLLMVAREFPVLPLQPRIAVYRSQFFAGQFPRETLELADGKLGTLEDTPVVFDAASAPKPDLEASLALMRHRMFERPGLIAGVFVGGMNGIVEEATGFKRSNPALPTYAVASAGGAAADLLNAQRVQAMNFHVADFCGGRAAPVPESMLRAEQVGYTLLSSVLMSELKLALNAKAIRPRP